MADVWKRIVSCLDHAGRPREVTAIVDDGRVTVHTPPGNTAALTPADARKLDLHLRDAVVEVLQNQGGF